jgi:hypothetical protein
VSQSRSGAEWGRYLGRKDKPSALTLRPLSGRAYEVVRVADGVRLAVGFSFEDAAQMAYDIEHPIRPGPQWS